MAYTLGDVTIIVTTYGRLHYLRPSLASLRAALRPYQFYDVAIIDDHSDNVTQEYLRQLCALYGWNLFLNEKRLGINANAKQRALHTYKPVVYATDSDMMYDESFVESLSRAVEVVDDITVISLYDSVSHQSKLLENNYFVQKESASTRSLLYTKEMFEDFLLNEGKDRAGKWGEQLVKYCVRTGVNMYSTKKSTVQHIGQFGENSDDAFFDTAIDK